jgi:hypothetical protein
MMNCSIPPCGLPVPYAERMMRVNIKEKDGRKRIKDPRLWAPCNKSLSFATNHTRSSDKTESRGALMKETHTMFIAILIVISLAAGCAQSSMKYGSPGGSFRKMMAPPAAKSSSLERTSASLDEESSKSEDKSDGTEAPKSGESRMIIYTAHITMIVKDIDIAAKTLTGMVKETNGYIISSSQNSAGDEGKIARYTIKVPVSFLTPFTDKIGQLGKVTSQDQTGQDVTEEFVDQSARLHNMQLEENKYQEMYEKSKSVEDMLKVRRELGKVRGDIEALQGRLKYIKNNVAMATVELNLEERRTGTPKSFWDFRGSASGAFTTLKYVIKTIVVLAIYAVIVLLPLVLIFIAFGRLLGKMFPKKGKVRLSSRGTTQKTTGEAQEESESSS